jgi:hypothetical protein
MELPKYLFSAKRHLKCNLTGKNGAKFNLTEKSFAKGHYKRIFEKRSFKVES